MEGYLRLKKKAKTAGAEVRVLSEVHESGKRLDALSGIAAILSYPIHELEELNSDEEDEWRFRCFHDSHEHMIWRNQNIHLDTQLDYYILLSSIAQILSFSSWIFPE